MNSRKKVVIVGGGFGGLRAGRALTSAPVEVTLIDRRNFQDLTFSRGGRLTTGDAGTDFRFQEEVTLHKNA